MDVRWREGRQVDGEDPANKRKAKRNRAGLFAALTTATAALSGLASLLGIGPFGGLQALANVISHTGSSSTEINANTIFPPVPPVHKTVDVYDPAPPAPPAPKPKPPAASPTPVDGSPTPPARSSPSPSQPPGDN